MQTIVHKPKMCINPSIWIQQIAIPNGVLNQWAVPPDRMQTVRPRRAGAKTSAINAPPLALHDKQSTSTDLLLATSRLTLQNARQLRQLSATILRTITIPDSSQYGQPLGSLARKENAYHEQAMIFMWANIMLIIIEHPPEGAPVEATRFLQEHVNSCNNPEFLKYAVLECSLSRTWQGDSTILKVAVAPSLHTVLNSLTQLLVAAGAHMRFGPPPKGPLERAATTALQQHMATRS
jgi:hypothetical protein